MPAAMVASLSCCSCRSSAGLGPHLHLQRKREVRLITLVNIHHGILRTFAIVWQRGCLKAKLKDTVQGLDIVRLPEVLETVSMARARLRLLVGEELGMMTS